MIRVLITAIIISVLGGCASHLTLMALDKEASNQQKFTDNYDYEMQQMESKDAY